VSRSASIADEAAGRIVELYDRHAARFDSDRDRGLFEKSWLDRFRALIPSGGTVLDLGCGVGEPLAGYLIEMGHAVTGVDASPAMIAICKARFPRQRWIVADMRTLSLGHGFDAILAWDSLFHLTAEDQERTLEAIGRHALPGAALMFTSGPRAGIAIGEYFGEALYHASLDPDGYRSCLVRQGFTVVSYVADDVTCGGHTIWLARRSLVA